VTGWQIGKPGYLSDSTVGGIFLECSEQKTERKKKTVVNYFVVNAKN
jgi:hypothetical protein